MVITTDTNGRYKSSGVKWGQLNSVLLRGEDGKKWGGRAATLAHQPLQLITANESIGWKLGSAILPPPPPHISFTCVPKGLMCWKMIKRIIKTTIRTWNAGHRAL